MLTSHESGIGALNHEIDISAAQSALKTQTFTKKDPYLIGKYASKNGTTSAQQNFQSSHGAIGESTFRLFKSNTKP